MRRVATILLCLVPFALHAQLRVFTIDELKQRAESGDAEAQFRLGSAYDTGRDVPRDGAQARKWYQHSAEAGYAEAQNSMGSVLQAEKRYAEARPWYERAAAQNNAPALNNLAYLYDLGLSVDQDRKKAFDLYSQSANLGWAEAMWNLVIIYGAGQIDGKKDLSHACVWTFRARRYMGSDQRIAAMSERSAQHLQHNLSAQEFSSCKQQAENWQPKATK